MKIGSIMQCVDANGSESLELFGIYEVIAHNEFGNIQVKNVNSGQILAHFYKPCRFFLTSVKRGAKKIVDKKEIDFSKTYITRDGCRVNLLAYSQDEIYPIIGEVFQGGKWNSEKWKKDGKFFECDKENDLDLIEQKTYVSCDGFEVFICDDGSIQLYGDFVNASIEKEQIAEIIQIWQKFN